MAAVTPIAFDVIYGIAEAEICNKALSRLSADVIKDTLEDTKQSRACRGVYSQTRDELLRTYPFNFAMKTAYIPQDEDFPYPMDEYSYAFKAEDHVAFTGTATSTATITAITGLTVDSSLVGRVVKGTNVQDGSRIVSIVDTVGAETITLDRPTLGAASNLSCYIPVLKLIEIAHNDNNLFEVIGGGESRRILCNMYSPEGGVVAEPYELEIKYVEQVIDPAKFDSMFLDALAIRIASKICVPLTQNAALVQMLQQEFAAIMQIAQGASSQERQVDQSEPLWSDRQQTGEIQTRR